jgi:ATP adenylyltransferase
MEKLFSPWRSQYMSSFANEPKDTGCVLCNAYNSDNDEESLVIYRGKEAFVIMNRFPYNSGHLMIVPIRHTSDFQSLTQSECTEMFSLLQTSEEALKELSKPQAFNIGMNLGRVAGAGIDDHLHWHIVPRWNGDTNFLPVLGDVKVVSEDMAAQWQKLHSSFPGKIRERKR